MDDNLETARIYVAKRQVWVGYGPPQVRSPGNTRFYPYRTYSMRPSVPPPHQKSPALIKKGKLVWMMKSGRDAAEKELGVEPIASAFHSRGCGAKHAANLPW